MAPIVAEVSVLPDYGSLFHPESTSSPFLEPKRSLKDCHGHHVLARHLEEHLEEIINLVANVLVWYAFGCFGYLSDVFGDEFFPPDLPGDTALMESFAVFGGAFLVRPIGGLWMGYIGDKYGRMKALETSLLLMATATISIGCLPTYHQVGHWAPLLLTTLRLMQGLSGGGQLMSSLVVRVENKPKAEWGLHGSYVMATANFGTLLCGVTMYILRLQLSDAQVHSFGWRFPFLSGVPLLLCWLVLRYHHPSSKDDIKRTVDTNNAVLVNYNPVAQSFAPGNRRSLLAACIVPVLWSAGFWVTFVWMTIYMYKLIPNPIQEAYCITSISMFLGVCVLFPAAGALSDHYGRRRVMTLGATIYGIFSPILVLCIGTGNEFLAFPSILVLGICLSLWGGPMMAWLAESFDPEVRLTCTGFGYNLGVGIMAGISPAMETFIVDEWGYRAPGLWMSLLAGISLFGLWCVAPGHVEATSEHQPLVQGEDFVIRINDDISDDKDEPI